jgi:hypothetical protein
MTSNLREELRAVQARVAEGNEQIARLKAIIRYLERNGEETEGEELKLHAALVRHRLNFVELNRLIGLATPAIAMPSEVIPFAAHARAHSN